MTRTARAIIADCPDCLSTIRFEKLPELGEFLYCPECDETLEVVRLEPLKLGWAFAEPFATNERYQTLNDDVIDDMGMELRW